MCGIAGTLVFDNAQFRVTGPYLSRMRDQMAHRGPDGAGLWIAEDGRIGLAHRRLAIIDLSDSAAQPMSDGGGLHVVFNGEIFNHVELREELRRLGHSTWTTDHSDTEVILRTYAQWGIAGIHRLRGMFAIALWDDSQKILWLIRDRLGIKPLYFSVHHGRLTFASEIKSLLADPEQNRRVDEEALHDYLSFLTSPAPKTLFEGIEKVSAATWVRVTPNGSMVEERYWEAFDHSPDLDGKPETEIVQALRSALSDSFECHTVSDVPVGVFLSGGLDSSAIAAMNARTGSGPVRTFSIGYGRHYDSYADELPYARQMAEAIGAEHKERVLVVNELIEFLPKMIWSQDEPIGDPLCFPLYYLSRLARDNGVVVCQVGEGADELFFGYTGWKTALQLSRVDSLPVPRILKMAGLGLLRLAGRDDTTYYELLRRGAEGVPIFWGGAQAFTESQKQRVLSPRLRRLFARRTSWDSLRPIRERFEERRPRHAHFDWMRYLDLNLRLPELLLMRMDKMSMAVGVEVRVPFLDHRLVEFAMGVPDSLMLKNGRFKHLLKEAVAPDVPPNLVNRPKQGFVVPVREWFIDQLGEHAREVLMKFCAETDYLNRRTVIDLLERRQGHRIWYLLNVALWWNTFIGQRRGSGEG